METTLELERPLLVKIIFVSYVIPGVGYLIARTLKLENLEWPTPVLRVLGTQGCSTVKWRKPYDIV
jgi:hypothetical protein